MIKCVTQKKVYLTQELAEEALIGARTRFEYATGQGPVAVYRCEDCGYFHLTSKGPVNTTLDQHQKNGKIDREKQANEWLNKMKHKRS
jgi:hypothetical protein